jgi:hypothetical protein
VPGRLGEAQPIRAQRRSDDVILLPMAILLVVLGLVLLVAVNVLLGLVLLAAGFALTLAALPFAPWTPWGAPRDEVVVHRRPHYYRRRRRTTIVEDDGPYP